MFAAASSPAARESVSFPCVIKQFPALSKETCRGGKTVWSCTGKSPRKSDSAPWDMIQNCEGGRCSIDYRWQGITGIPPEIGQLQCAHQIEWMYLPCLPVVYQAGHANTVVWCSDLFGNKIEGKLPSELGNLVGLKIL